MQASGYAMYEVLDSKPQVAFTFGCELIDLGCADILVDGPPDRWDVI